MNNLEPKLEELLGRLRDIYQQYVDVIYQMNKGGDLSIETRLQIEMACNLQFIRGSLEGRIINQAASLHDPEQLHIALETIKKLS